MSFLEYIKDPKAKIPGTKMIFAGIKNENRSRRPLGVPRAVRQGRQDQVKLAAVLRDLAEPRPLVARSRLQASVCTITGPAIAVAGPVNSGASSCSIHASARLFDSSAAA